jgi:hypothetical protein
MVICEVVLVRHPAASKSMARSETSPFMAISKVELGCGDGQHLSHERGADWIHHGGSHCQDDDRRRLDQRNEQRNGLVDSGAIRVAKDIASLVIQGNVAGNATSRLVLAAAGTGSNHVAIGKLSIGGNAEYLDVLGGYSATGVAAGNRLGNLVSVDALIKQVTIAKNVNALNIVSGVAPGADGRFGTSDDAFGAGTNVINDVKFLATIAEVTIKGSVAENPMPTESLRSRSKKSVREE